MRKLIETIKNIWNIEDLRNRILTTLGILAIYRLGCFVVIPGVDPAQKLNKKTVVTTVMSNLGFEKYIIDKLGIKLIRKAVGDINVISEMQKNNEVPNQLEAGENLHKPFQQCNRDDFEPHQKS